MSQNQIKSSLSPYNQLLPGALAVVIGAGASGLAACRLLRLLGQKVRLVDQHVPGEAVQHEAAQLEIEIMSGKHSSEQFAGAALVVVSPGVPLQAIESVLKAAGSPRLVGEIELGLWFVTEPIIAITGTSGKTTTASLTAAMLELAGHKVFLGGNIGTPLCSYVMQPDRDKILVLELSSFQLQLCPSLHPKVSVLLNLTENHLDQHRDMQEYQEAKLSIFKNQEHNDLAVLPAELASLYRSCRYKAPLMVPDSEALWPSQSLLGKHNQFNAEVAYLACQPFGVSRADAVKAVETFKVIPHRLEQVHTHNGVLFVNDSKSTTVESLRAALESFDAPVILLAGGKYKGGDLASLLPLLQSKVKQILLYGASREVFEAAWQGSISIAWLPSLTEAVPYAFQIAAPGDVVLLSPATSSYDQYANYIERGNDFTRLARELE